MSGQGRDAVPLKPNRIHRFTVHSSGRVTVVLTTWRSMLSMRTGYRKHLLAYVAS